MVNRRQLGIGLVAAGVGGCLSSTAAATPSVRKNVAMHVGGDYHSVAGDDIASTTNLEYNLRHGVTHLTAQLTKRPPDGWDDAELNRIKTRCDQRGMILEAIRMDSDYIKLAAGANRDRELDTIIGNIRKAARHGVKIITYNWEVIPARRNLKVSGRGGSVYDSFKLEPDWKSLPIGVTQSVTHHEYWDRIAHFLQKVIPAAADADVRMACHPYDPPGLPFGYMGVDQWDSPAIFEAIRRYESIVDSPYNGFQLDLGTTAAGLANPAAELLPIVQYLGERGKIYQVHMRNIRGRINEFSMVYPDEGDIDFLKTMRILRDTKFSGSICPDHMPSHADDPGGFQAFAFGYGYIKALIHAVNSEVD